MMKIDCVDPRITALLARLQFIEVAASRGRVRYQRGYAECVLLTDDGDWIFSDSRIEGFALHSGRGFVALAGFLPKLIGLVGFLPEAPL